MSDDGYEQMRVVDLKELLTERGLDTSKGVKAELISRLREADLMSGLDDDTAPPPELAAAADVAVEEDDDTAPPPAATIAVAAPAATVAVPATTEPSGDASADDAATLSASQLIEQKKARAARFGTEYVLTADDRKMLAEEQMKKRAERFGIEFRPLASGGGAGKKKGGKKAGQKGAAGKKGTNAAGGAKKGANAKAAAPKKPVIGGEVAVDAEALARRAERFGTTTPAASTAATAEAKRKRAAKFGMSSGDPDESPNKKSKGE